MKTPQKNWLEWSCFIIGLLLVAGVLGFLVRDALTTGHAPPRIEFKLGQAEELAGRFRVPVTVHNLGDRSAESLQVEVVLKAAGREERGEYVVDHLPRQGTREGYVTFMTDPRKAETLEARAAGFQAPE